MGSETRIRSEVFHRKIQATKAASTAARNAAGKEMGGIFIDAIVELTARDTNRTVDAWVQAGREAGVTDRPRIPLKPSKSRAKFLNQMRDEIAYFLGEIEKAQGWVDKYDREDQTRHSRRKSNGKLPKRRKSQPFYKKQKAIIRKATKNATRAAEELAKAEGSESAIFFDANSIVQRKKNRKFTTVRAKVYGGSGSVLLDRARYIVTLINKEPQARIIEKHPHLGHPLATARAMTRRFGIQRVGRKYRNSLREQSPFGTRNKAA